MPEPMPTAAEAVGKDEPRPKEWWEEAGMPWKHKPTKADKQAMGWIIFMGLFGLAMLPLRGWLLGLDPPLLLALTGSRTGAAATGALASQNLAPSWWPWAFVLGSLMSIKFDWVFWWAGKLWGRGMIEVWAGRSTRAARNYERAERWAHKMGWVGIFVAYVPIPLPLMQVIFVLAGASGMSWKKFMALDFVASTVWLLGYFAFGWAVGEPAVELLKQYAKIANWVAIGLLVFIFAQVFWSQRKKPAAS
nr:VTT domain-containing protein [Aestuariimicrobium ganziense]